MEIEFGELPPPSGRYAQRSAHAATAEKLRANPGQWARLIISSDQHAVANLAYRIRHGQAVAFRPAGAFEATSQGRDLWVRYIGDPSS